uniref:Uncharacterized protein n=1 Tax=Mustela putorius furo TaxID=9669 RepID=M3YX69_MUSPF
MAEPREEESEKPKERHGQGKIFILKVDFKENKQQKDLRGGAGGGAESPQAWKGTVPAHESVGVPGQRLWPRGRDGPPAPPPTLATPAVGGGWASAGSLHQPCRVKTRRRKSHLKAAESGKSSQEGRNNRIAQCACLRHGPCELGSATGKH